jgi:hypothetical protein
MANKINPATFQSAGQISQHWIPGAFSRIDSVQGNRGLASANNGVVMGQCTGGKPATLLQFNTAAAAVETLRSGPLMEAVKLAFSPGNSLVPQRIYAMRVNNATQSTLNLQASSNTMITLTSLGYGLWANQIKVTVETGTNYGKKVTIQYQNQTAEVFDDIRQQVFTIQNTGGASSMTIVNNSSTKTLTTTTTNPLSITLTDYPTIGELAAYINGQTGYTCTAVAGAESFSTSELDGVSSQDINTSAYTAESSMEAMIDTITAGSAWVSAVAANATNDRSIVDNLVETYMTGGSEGSYTSTEWTAALLALEAEDIQFISTPDGTAAQHAQIKTHCEAMSAVTGKKERQFMLGAPWGTGTVATDITSAKTASANLNSKYGMYVFNGGKQYNNASVITNFGASYVACMLMGQKIAAAINQPLTYNTLNLLELEYKLTNSQLEDLIKNAVAPNALNTSQLPHHVRQVNTYQTSDLKWNEFSVVSQMLFASRDLRGYLEAIYVGKPGTAVVGGALRGSVESRLNQYVDLGLFIKDPNTNQAWWGVSITLSGDTVIIDYDAYLTVPVNFIFITNHFHELVAAA